MEIRDSLSFYRENNAYKKWKFVIVYHFTIKSNAYKKFLITKLVESGGKLVI
jgi:hypothetical protein